MIPEIASAFLGAALGVLGTYVFDLRRSERERRQALADQERERERHRQTVATALMQDLRELEFHLREVFDSPDPTRLGVTRPAFLYDALKPEVRWLTPESVEPLVELHRRANHVYAIYHILREAGRGQIAPSELRQYEIRSQAAFALQFLPRAVEALRQEGAKVPKPVGWGTVTFPQLPAVPPPFFDDAIARAVTKGERGSVEP